MLRNQRDEETTSQTALRCKSGRNIGGFEGTTSTRYEHELLRGETDQQNNLQLVFNPNNQLSILDVQKFVLIPEDAAEEWRPVVDQQNPEPLHIKEEEKEEELWTSLKEEQLNVKEETDATRFPSTAVPLKSDDDDEKPLFSQFHQQNPDPVQIKEEELWTILKEEQLNVKEETDVTRFPSTTVPLKSDDDEEKPVLAQLHQHQVEDQSLPTSRSDDQMEAATGKGDCGAAETRRNQDLCTFEDEMDSSETDVSDDEDGDENNPKFQRKHKSDSGSKTESSCMKSKSRMKSSTCLVTNKFLKVGKNVQTTLKSFRCDDCGKRFVKKRYLNQHTKIHRGEKPFCCELCGQRFIHRAHLNKHLRSHTGEKPFSCDVCEQRFSCKTTLNTHMMIHTGQKPFACDVCEQRFPRKTTLNTHMRIHTGQKPFACVICGQRFRHKTVLNRHMRIHTGQKPFACDVCEQRFSHKTTLNTHMMIHTGQKPFACVICGQRFRHKTVLNRHIKIHADLKPFACNVCEQRFVQISTLNTHMRIHTDPKPFACVICEQRFSRKSNLNRHMRIHSRN